MNVLIIEDEPLAQAKLESLLLNLDESIIVKARLTSVKESIAWLQTHPAPDVAFVDIQLSDDHSFEIFRHCSVQFPVIFTTAYDKYLLKSFEYNSIDYILKPITKEKLKHSLKKIEDFKTHFLQFAIQDIIRHATPATKKRIIVKKGADFIALEADRISYFFVDQKIVFLKDVDNQRFIADRNLGELEGALDKKDFFRINRKILAHRNAIERFKSENGKMRIFLKPVMKEDVFVSKEGAPDFRKWIEGADR